MFEGLLNTTDYTTTELVLFTTGCYLWVVVYGIYLWQIRKFKFSEMPVLAACSNIGWEFVWGFSHPLPDMGALIVWGYRIWFILDLGIFTAVLAHGQSAVATKSFLRHFKFNTIAAAILWGILYYAFKKQGLDTIIGANSAYIAQILISLFYPLVLMERGKLLHDSWAVAWLRTIGTGLISIFMFMHYHHMPFLKFLAILSGMLDCYYIYCFAQLRSKAKRNEIAEPVEGSLQPA